MGVLHGRVLAGQCGPCGVPFAERRPELLQQLAAEPAAHGARLPSTSLLHNVPHDCFAPGVVRAHGLPPRTQNTLEGAVLVQEVQAVHPLDALLHQHCFQQLESAAHRSVCQPGAEVIAVPWGTPNADGLGVALSIVSTLAIAGKTSLSTLLMKDAKKDGLTPIVLVWYDSICLLLIAQLMMGEWFKISQFTSHEPVITVFAMCAGSIMAFTYNFVSFKFIQMTSSVTHAIAGNLKLFAVVVLPAMFIDHITSV